MEVPEMAKREREMWASRYYRLDADTMRLLEQIVAADGMSESEVYRRLVRAEAERRGYVQAQPVEPENVNPNVNLLS
jgi:hypothetical protein